MKVSRAILSGIIIWVLIFVSFTVMSFIPVIKDSELQQNLILYIILLPIVIIGAKFYYKKGSKANGLLLGLLISITGLLLDAIITIPVVIIPHGGDYMSFYLDPLLWGIIAEFILITYFYWKVKVK